MSRVRWRTERSEACPGRGPARITLRVLRRKKKRRSNRQPPAAARGWPRPWSPPPRLAVRGQEHGPATEARQHTARSVKDHLTYSGAQRPARGVGAPLPPHGTPVHARAEARLTRSLARAGVRLRWPCCWCAQRGRALTQESCGSTLQNLARRVERPQRASGRSGEAAYLQERSDWQSPRAGVRGREESMARAERSGAGAFLLEPRGGSEGRQGAASI